MAPLFPTNCIKLMKILKEPKKRLYELEDDFDYLEKNENTNGNKNITFESEGNDEENKFGIN